MPLSTQQKAAITSFVNFTSTDKKVAERILKANNWNLDQAVDSYFANPGNAQPNANAAPLNKLFDKYRDDPQDAPDLIQMSGTMSYLGDLSVPIEDNIAPLVLFELLSSPTLGEIHRQGFVAGWSAHSATSLAAQKAALSQLVAQLSGAESRAGPNGLFRRVYKHTFRVACPAGAKSVPLDMAVEYWKLLLGAQGAAWTGAGGRTPWLDWWIAFLGERWKKAVNRDLWDQTLLFADRTAEDESLAWWSEEAAWPGVIDEFVRWVRSEKGVGAAAGTDASAAKDGEAMEVE